LCAKRTFLLGVLVPWWFALYLRQHRSHPRPELRQQLRLEPRVLAHPEDVAPARMRQHEAFREIVAPRLDRRAHRRLGRAGEVPVNAVRAGEDLEARLRIAAGEPSLPERRAFLARRQVAAALVAPGIAEAHRHDRDTALVVEALAVDAEPSAQHVAAAVVEGEAGRVHLGAGRLTDDHDPGRKAAAHDRPRPERQGIGADAAAA